ncbi:MAG: aminoacyl-tRNA hydrolase [Bacteroidia bacterium]|nr:aminoacyl-tRNA hydrolase [Bacteroidia bacterium]
MKPYLIVGLGNPGEEYKNTRHNIGFDIADALVKKFDACFEKGRLADIALFSLKGKKIYVIKPNTYMNCSGRAVRYWWKELNTDLKNMMVLVDELALPLGKIRINPKGSDGGHNGLKDIQSELQTTEYPRLRFGIDKNFSKGNQSDYVLGKWNENEKEAVNLGIEKSISAIQTFILEGIEKCMNTFNK